jgi:hypothetical protein
MQLAHPIGTEAEGDSGLGKFVLLSRAQSPVLDRSVENIKVWSSSRRIDSWRRTID